MCCSYHSKLKTSHLKLDACLLLSASVRRCQAHAGRPKTCNTRAYCCLLVWYAALQLVVTQPQMLGLKAEGLAGCCTVCRHGHLAFLQQELTGTSLPGSSSVGVCGCCSPAAAAAAAQPFSSSTACQQHRGCGWRSSRCSSRRACQQQ